MKATIHWVSTAHAIDIEAAMYDRLFTAEVPGERTGDPFDDLNRRLARPCSHGKAEAALARRRPRARRAVRAPRLLRITTPAQHGLFHRTVGLKDEWANIQKRAK